MITTPKRAVTRVVRSPGKGGHPRIFLELDCGHQVARTGRDASLIPERVACTRCFVSLPIPVIGRGMKRARLAPIQGPATAKAVAASAASGRRRGRGSRA